MGTDQIREVIAGARLHEQKTGALQQYFQANLQQLHTRLLLPETDAAAHLLGFVEKYIDYVPVFIDSVTGLCLETGVYRYVSPFLHIAEDYFLTPPAELDQETGLHGLMDSAFLAQRLIEEVNDRHIQYLRTPLLPVDMTRANIIVHHLIGDRLANRLDGLVEHTVFRLVDREHLFDPPGYVDSGDYWTPDQWQNLPCLSRDAMVDLRLTDSSPHQSPSPS